jgi:hypothetical protein
MYKSVLIFGILQSFTSAMHFYHITNFWFESYYLNLKFLPNQLQRRFVRIEHKSIIEIYSFFIILNADAFIRPMDATNVFHF